MKLNKNVKAVTKQPVVSRTAPVKKLLKTGTKETTRVRRSAEEVEDIRDTFLSMKPVDPTRLGGVILPKSMRPSCSTWAKNAGLTVVSFTLPKDDSKAVFLALKTK